MPISEERPTRRLSSKLKVVDHKLRALLGTYDMGGLKFDPSSFVIESPKLEQKIIEASVQEASYTRFLANPCKAMTYLVAGNPDDQKAKYFAFHLAELHQRHLGLKADLRIETVVGNFDNPLIVNREAAPSMLIITNLTIRSSNLKFEKVRDLIERFPRIPKVIVAAGEDPISFAATRLHLAVHGIAYFGNRLSKTMNEVI